VPAYTAVEQPHPAIVHHATERFARLHWLYWQIYTTHIDPSAYRTLFGRELARDFGHILLPMRLAGWTEPVNGGWALTERGSAWAHRLQMLYSLTYIDALWRRCHREAWPEAIVLQ
jgi:hypothetical protein